MEKKSIFFFVLFVIMCVAMYFLFTNPFLNTDSREGEILNVQILNFENNPVKNIEVDLWRASQITGPPIEFLLTDKNGIASFNLTKGNYYFGFNLETFPVEDYIYPGKIQVNVSKHFNEKIIVLETNA